MTKIYVVQGRDFDKNNTFVFRVFTNLRKAEIYVDYLNLLFEKETEFWTTTYLIENDDYTSSLENLRKKRGLI